MIDLGIEINNGCGKSNGWGDSNNYGGGRGCSDTMEGKSSGGDKYYSTGCGNSSGDGFYWLVVAGGSGRGNSLGYEGPKE